MRMTYGEKVFNVCNVSLLLLFSICCIYPFLYVTALSFNDGLDAMRGDIYIWPRAFTLVNYETIFQDERIMGSLLISVYRTALGAAITVLFNSCFAFALTKRDLPGRKAFNWIVLIAMFFYGGLIPYFLVCKALGLVNTFWVFVIPGAIVPFYIMMFRVYYMNLPIELEESAMLDGAGYFTVFFRIYFPLSTPILATIALLSGIGHWNDWYTGTVMVASSRLWPLQTLLLNILQGSDLMQFFKEENLATAGRVISRVKITPESIKMAILVCTVAPIAIIYPFAQKYFVKGMLIGSLKG